MTTHELAKELLKLPDIPVLTTDGEYGYPHNVTGVLLDRTNHYEEKFLGIKENTQICRFNSSGGYGG